MELLRHNKERAKYLLNYHCKVIILTVSHLFDIFEELLSAKYTVGTLILPEAGNLLDFQSFASLAVCRDLRTAVFLGDDSQNPPSINCRVLEESANLSQSMFVRLQRLGYPVISLHQQGASTDSITSLYKWKYPGLANFPHSRSLEGEYLLPGLKSAVQFIDLATHEHTPVSGQYVNLGEAEFAVALFTYLVLNGVSSQRIAILVATPSQKDLVEEVVLKKAAWHKTLGRPGVVSTVYDFEGQKADIVILSLVRTSSLGEMHSDKKLVTALSRARQALIILGSLSTYKADPSFGRVLEGMKEKSHRLQLIDGEEVRSVEELSRKNQLLFVAKHPQSN